MEPSTELTAAELDRLYRVIARRSGLAFTEARRPFLKNRARQIMARRGFTSADRWAEALEAAGEYGGPLYAELEEALRIHETSFFRYPSHHRTLGEVVLPALVRDHSSPESPPIRIWSVGCSTGEEPYSIAMTVREAIPDPRRSPVEIIAVDVSQAALRVAARGTYPPASMAPVPPTYLAKHFVQNPDGFTVVPALREMVRFFRHDIRDDLYLGKFDVIFCCNVLLYYASAVKRRLLARLARCLRPGGYLFFGHAEGITPPVERFDSRRLPGGFIFRRSRGA